MTASKTSTIAGNGSATKFKTNAEPTGWGRREFTAALFLEDADDGNGQILASEPLEDSDYETPVAYVLQHYPREEGSSQPTHTLGLAQQTTAADGGWDDPISLCNMFPARDSAKEKAEEKGYQLPTLSGSPRGVDEMDPDDPDCCRYELFFGIGPDGKEIPQEEAHLFTRRRFTAVEKPKASSVAEFLGV
jgi:hypothetical protein